MKNSIVKKLFAGVLIFAVAIAGFVYVPEEARAEETTVVKYQPVTYDTFKTHINAKEAPECTLTEATEDAGYLFAGWFTTEGEPIKTSGDVTEGADNIVAKFVPAHLAGISCQVKADIGQEGVTKTNLRVVSLVHSTNYEAVGFNVYGRHDNDGDGVYTEWLMYKYDSENTNRAQSTKVYSGLQVYKMQDGVAVEDYVATPANVFGADASETEFKFTTMNLSGIPAASYNTIIAIKPYWITLDGTVVEGMGEFNRPQDSIDNIVNISVNLKDAEAIAAGMIDIEYDKSLFTYEGAEYGRVFKEMNVTPNDNVIKCVGNISEIKNTDVPNDVYVNLKFKKTDANNLAAGAANFEVTIPTNGFCDIEENIKTVNAWDVKY